MSRVLEPTEIINPDGTKISMTSALTIKEEPAQGEVQNYHPNCRCGTLTIDSLIGMVDLLEKTLGKKESHDSEIDH